MNYLLQETIPNSLTLTWNIPNCNPWHFSLLPSVLSDFLYDEISEATVILWEIGLVLIMCVFLGSRFSFRLDAGALGLGHTLRLDRAEVSPRWELTRWSSLRRASELPGWTPLVHKGAEHPCLSHRHYQLWSCTRMVLNDHLIFCLML